MVPPIFLNNPTRVFSRIPFTGEDKGEDPSCCDLSRVASIVGASPLPFKLSNSSAMSNQSNGISSKSELEKTNAKLTQGSDASNLLAAVKEEPVESNTNSNSNPMKKRRLSSDSNKPAKLMRLNSNGELRESNPQQPQGVDTPAVMAENAKLKQQVQILLKKLSTYQLIVQNEENYNIAVRKLREVRSRLEQNAVAQQ